MKLGFTLPLMALIILVLNTVPSNSQDLDLTWDFLYVLEEDEEHYKILEDYPASEQTPQAETNTAITITEPDSPPVAQYIGVGGVSVPDSPPVAEEIGVGGVSVPDSPPVAEEIGVGGVSVPDSPPVTQSIGVGGDLWCCLHPGSGSCPSPPPKSCKALKE